MTVLFFLSPNWVEKVSIYYLYTEGTNLPRGILRSWNTLFWEDKNHDKYNVGGREMVSREREVCTYGENTTTCGVP